MLQKPCYLIVERLASKEHFDFRGRVDILPHDNVFARSCENNLMLNLQREGNAFAFG